jgi:hypothetical protein
MMVATSANSGTATTIHEIGFKHTYHQRRNLPSPEKTKVD